MDCPPTVSEHSPPLRTKHKGGPRTQRGKAASRKNSTRDGLTATTLLPAILGTDLVNEHYRQLAKELRPATPLEEFWVREMARHAAALARVEQIEPAVLRRGARGVPLVPSDEFNESTRTDAALAGAGTGEAIDKVSRYRRMHERAFQAALAELRASREVRAQSSVAVTTLSVPEFESEKQCESHFRSRFDSPSWCCPHCRTTSGNFVSARQVWQCHECRRQTSLRDGTVMARSRLTLLTWFRAIKLFVTHAKPSQAALIDATGIQRRATLTTIRTRIEAALRSPTASQQLAGLDQFFGPQAS